MKHLRTIPKRERVWNSHFECPSCEGMTKEVQTPAETVSLWPLTVQNRDLDFIVPARERRAVDAIYFEICRTRRTESFQLQGLEISLISLKIQSQDDLSLQKAGVSLAPPFNASAARKPRSTLISSHVQYPRTPW